MAWKHRYCKVCQKITLWYDDKHGKYCTVCFND